MTTDASGTFNSLCRVLCTNLSLYMYTIGLVFVFSLTRSTPCVQAAVPRSFTHGYRGTVQAICCSIRNTGRGCHPQARAVPGHFFRHTPDQEIPRPHTLQCHVREVHPHRSRGCHGIISEMGQAHALHLHSPLLVQSWLLSFPPPTDMLKLGRLLYTSYGRSRWRRRSRRWGGVRETPIPPSWCRGLFVSGDVTRTRRSEVLRQTGWAQR